MAIISNNSSYYASDWIALDYTVPGYIVLGTGIVSSVASISSVILTGNSVTSSVGTLSFNNAFALTGNSTSSSIGSLSSNITIALTSNTSTVSVGTLSSNITIALTSNTSTVSVGNLTYSVGISGNTSTVSVGNLIPTVILSSIIGNVGSTSVGTEITNMILPLLNITIGTSIGIVTNSNSIQLSGITSTASSGNLTANIIKSVTGTDGTSNINSLSQSRSVSSLGNISTSNIGNILSNISLQLSGNSSSGDVSSIPSTSRILNTGGIESIISDGNIVFNKIVEISSDTQIDTSVGSIPETLVSYILQADLIQVQTSNVEGNITVSISGNSSNAIAGNVEFGWLLLSDAIRGYTVSLLGTESSIEITNISGILSKKIESSLLTRAYSGLIIQQRKNSLLGNTGSISFANEPTKVSSLITSVNSSGTIGTLIPEISVNTPPVEETVLGIAGNCKVKSQILLNGSVSTSTINAFSDAFVTDPNVTLSIVGNTATVYANSFSKIISKQLPVVFVHAQSGILNYVRSSSLLGNTATVSFASEQTVKTIQLSAVQSYSSVGTTLPKVNIASYGNVITNTIGDIDNSVTVSITGNQSISNVGDTNKQYTVGLSTVTSKGHTNTIGYSNVVSVQSGVTSNTNIASLVKSQSIRLLGTSISEETGSLTTSRITSVTSEQATIIANNPVSNLVISTIGSVLTVSINSLSEIRFTKPILGTFTLCIAGEIRPIEKPLEILSVGSIKFVQTYDPNKIQFVQNSPLKDINFANLLKLKGKF